MVKYEKKTKSSLKCNKILFFLTSGQLEFELNIFFYYFCISCVEIIFKSNLDYTLIEMKLNYPNKIHYIFIRLNI